MARTLPIACLNGVFQPVEAVRISPFDRGFLFADAVYEVVAVYGGRALLLEAHLDRLERSLTGLRLANPHDRAGWRALIGEIISRNGGGDLGVYLQVSRGADAGRDHAFPSGVAPTVFAMASALAPFDIDRAAVSAITAPDNRWGRCDIKSTALLANVLLREAARQAGAGECILIRNGQLTEGSSSTVVVVEGNTLLVPPPGPEVLPGTTVQLVRELAHEAGFGYREERVSEARLRAATEIWLTAALRGVAPVTRLDGAPVGTGEPGPVWRVIASAYERRKRS